MMICPETYYEHNLKGKTEKEVRSIIRGLKNEIGRLKNIAEHPESQCIIRPSEDVRIYCNRLYLERAKQYLVELGGEYIPSKAELKVQEFNDNLPNIAEIEFSIGGYFSGFPIYRVDLTADKLKALYTPPHTDKTESIPLPFDSDKNEFLDQFRDIHIGEWHCRYVNHNVLDGTEWYLIINYSNGKHPIRIYGSNAFPYNFDRLCDLFGVENDE